MKITKEVLKEINKVPITDVLLTKLQNARPAETATIIEDDECDASGFFDFSDCDYDDVILNELQQSISTGYCSNMRRFFLLTTSRRGAESVEPCFRRSELDDGFEKLDADAMMAVDGKTFAMFLDSRPQIYVAAFIIRSNRLKLMRSIVESEKLWSVWNASPSLFLWGVSQAITLMGFNRNIKTHQLNTLMNGLIVFFELLKLTKEFSDRREPLNADTLKLFLQNLTASDGEYYAGVPTGAEAYLNFLYFSNSAILPLDDTMELFRSMRVGNEPIEKVRELIKKRNKAR